MRRATQLTNEPDVASLRGLLARCNVISIFGIGRRPRVRKVCSGGRKEQAGVSAPRG